MITILGHTAAGKTAVAASVAGALDGEVISADSRQVYRDMDLGTGKDYADYLVNDKNVPVHLLDIHDAGYQYNVFEYKADFTRVYRDICSRGKVPVLCGGTGLYLEAVLKGYRMIDVPVNEELREQLGKSTLEQLSEMLSGLRPLHNTTDIVNRKRLVRAIEIALYEKDHPLIDDGQPEICSLVTGIAFNREERRERITRRLKQRLDEGMIEEVRALLNRGLSPEQLDYYGLEYRYLTLYATGKISYEEMFETLNTAIHRFAKRQMTYFRGMERRGTEIRWLDEKTDTEGKVRQIMAWYSAT